MNVHLETRVELITPEIAKLYLSLSKGNRAIRPIWVSQLASEMKAKRFLLSHESIGFLVDGSLFDGHHRLNAVIQSGETVQMSVTRGTPHESAMVVNRGRSRSTVDAYQMAGEQWFSRQYAAIGRMWMALLGKKSPSDSELFNFCVTNRLFIEIAIGDHERSKKTIFSHACVSTVLAIGIKAGKGDSLEGWYKCFATGIASEPWQTSAICFREWWLRGGNRNGGADVRLQLCKRCYGSMRAWCDRRSLSKSYEAATIDWLEVLP